LTCLEKSGLPDLKQVFMTDQEKTNYNKDGKCTTECLEDEQACKFYDKGKFMFGCIHFHSATGHCLNPEAGK